MRRITTRLYFMLCLANPSPLSPTLELPFTDQIISTARAAVYCRNNCAIGTHVGPCIAYSASKQRPSVTSAFGDPEGMPTYCAMFQPAPLLSAGKSLRTNAVSAQRQCWRPLLARICSPMASFHPYTAPVKAGSLPRVCLVAAEVRDMSKIESFIITFGGTDPDWASPWINPLSCSALHNVLDKGSMAHRSNSAQIAL
ncbi:hypothetical protein M011DRAFT_80353 [Sporormia fimetaria CBS 119925]|uniref:Uncharacterized protein n=1 Tax=Sporormia fimetaria CBS 119925 TaxID=1340428 RepID=A0A6A6V9N2_9PLEO|nr:hypothetical protein M011DRAFT_80353 [Sporormia fimetaria CBS 119925]